MECLYVCPVCNYPCCRDTSLLAHMNKVHQGAIINADSHAVSLQDVILKIKKVLENHQSTVYKCLKCSTTHSSRLKLSQHICVDPKGKVTCKAVCPDGVGLSNWQMVMFLKKKTEYLCHTCGTSFTDKTTFHMHVQSHGAGMELKKFVCEHCPYATNNKFYFKVHMRGQHCEQPRPRPHVCELCGKTFVFKGVLEQHKQYMHVKDKIFQCDICPKFFYRRQGLARHLRTHSGQRPWVCTHCGQGFTVKYNLKVHERLHSGEKPYKCKQCDAAFAQKNSLNVHMKKHEGRVGRDFSSSHQHHSRAAASNNSAEGENWIPFSKEESKPSQPVELLSRPQSRNVSNPPPVRDMSSPPQWRETSDPQHPRERPELQHSAMASGSDPRRMQYGYAPFPDYAMPVFPSLPGPSYQFMPVTRP